MYRIERIHSEKNKQMDIVWNVFHGNVISLVAELENLGDNQSGNQKP